jgi:alkylated DNA repair protein (DNA oxidative demethylase)
MPARRRSIPAEAPEGFTCRNDFLNELEQRTLLAEVESYPFHEVVMRGQAARRTVIHFGWDYDYDGWKIHPTTPPGETLRQLRDRCAEAAGVEASSLEQFLVARYPPGATIGWHRDAPMFGTPVIGVSLASACTMKFRRKSGESYEQFVQLLEPGSLYVLDGAARSQWQHSIPPTKGLRYSITMRTLRHRPGPAA